MLPILLVSTHTNENMKSTLNTSRRIAARQVKVVRLFSAHEEQIWADGLHWEKKTLIGTGVAGVIWFRRTTRERERERICRTGFYRLDTGMFFDFFHKLAKSH